MGSGGTLTDEPLVFIRFGPYLDLIAKVRWMRWALDQTAQPHRLMLHVRHEFHTEVFVADIVGFYSEHIEMRPAQLNHPYSSTRPVVATAPLSLRRIIGCSSMGPGLPTNVF